MYSLPASRVHELRGKQHVLCLTDQETISIVRLAASNTFLETITLKLSMETRRKRQKVFKNLRHFIISSLTERDYIDKLNAQKLAFLESRNEFNLEEWEQDIILLTTDCNKVDYLHVYTQALIHSNLFDSNVNKNHLKLKNHLKFPVLSLRQMVDSKYKKPFICFYDAETGNKSIDYDAYYF